MRDSSPVKYIRFKQFFKRLTCSVAKKGEFERKGKNTNKRIKDKA